MKLGQFMTNNGLNGRQNTEKFYFDQKKMFRAKWPLTQKNIKTARTWTFLAQTLWNCLSKCSWVKEALFKNFGHLAFTQFLKIDRDHNEYFNYNWSSFIAGVLKLDTKIDKPRLHQVLNSNRIIKSCKFMFLKKLTAG